MNKALNWGGTIAAVATVIFAVTEYFDAKAVRSQERSFSLASAFFNERGTQALSAVGMTALRFSAQAEEPEAIRDFKAHLGQAYKSDPSFALAAHYIYDFFALSEACIASGHCDMLTFQLLTCRQADDLFLTLKGLSDLKRQSDSSFGAGMEALVTRCQTNAGA